MTIGRTPPPDDDDRTTVVQRRTETRVVDPSPYVPSTPGGQVNVSTAPASQVNVSAVPAATTVWTFTRVVALLFTVLEVLLLVRFLLKLAGANQSQPFVAALFGVTEPLVRPFQGIFAIPADSAFDVAALMAIVFLFLVAALIVALVKAIAGRSA